MVPPPSHGVPRVPRYSGSSLLPLPFEYEALTLSGGPSHTLLLGSGLLLAVLTPYVFLPMV